jgi:EmrB/QacA subfamily drug resistance transporter
MADPQIVPSSSDPEVVAGGTARPSWDRRKWYILTAICVAQFMVVLDIAVVNVALPSIRSDLHFTVESLQWVISAYAIFFGGFLLLGGRLADVLGRRRIFMTGLVLFSAASLMCGFAWSEISLITFRSIQGLGGALLSPAALSILVTTFAEGRERNLALGVWGGIAGSGAAAGTLLGGVLTSALGWQWIFYINVPIGAALIALSPALLPAGRDRDAARRGFDVPGAVTATGGLMVLVYALTRATQIGWGAAETISLLIGAAVLLLAFIVIELRSRHPVLPLRILGLPTPRAANVIGFLIAAALFSQFFLLSLYMQQVLHYSALKTGVAYIAVTFLSVVSAVVAQALVTRIGVRIVLAVGMLLLAVALVLYTRLPVNGSYVADLLPGFLISGLGLGLAFVPDSIAALTGTRPSEAGAASGMINTSQQIGGAVGLAAITTIATTATTNYLHSHASLGPLAPVSALVHGFQIGFLVLAGVSLVAAVLAAVLITPAPAAVGAFEPAVESGSSGRPGRAVPSFARPVRVLGLVSSADPGSYSRAMLRAARNELPEGMVIDEFDLASLPSFEEGCMHDGEGEPAPVAKLRTAMHESDAILLAAPQYDRGARGALANAFVWAGRSDADQRILVSKPLAVMGRSCDEREMDQTTSEVRGAFRASAPKTDGSDEPTMIMSCERSGRSDGRDAPLRESVRGLLLTLFDTARPDEQAV